MKSIGEFFVKIRGKHAEEIFLRTIVQKSVKELSGADVPLEAIGFKPKTLILRGLSQSAKSAVFVKRTAIIKDLGSRQNARPIQEIRFEG